MVGPGASRIDHVIGGNHRVVRIVQVQIPLRHLSIQRQNFRVRYELTAVSAQAFLVTAEQRVDVYVKPARIVSAGLHPVAAQYGH